MTTIPFRSIPGLAGLLACLSLVSCENTKKKTGYDDVVDYTSPNTRMSKEEFPFDDQGNYREDWAAAGAGVSGVKDKPTVRYTPYVQEPDESERPPAVAVRNSPAPSVVRSSPGPSVVRSSPGPSVVGSSPGPSVVGSSSGSSEVRRSSSGTSSSRSTASRPKPKPKPRPKPKPTFVKVNSGDTLYSFSKRYGVSVASIKAANGLKSDLIVDGRSLKIPKKP